MVLVSVYLFCVVFVFVCVCSQQFWPSSVCVCSHQQYVRISRLSFAMERAPPFLFRSQPLAGKNAGARKRKAGSVAKKSNVQGPPQKRAKPVQKSSQPPARHNNPKALPHSHVIAAKPHRLCRGNPKRKYPGFSPGSDEWRMVFDCSVSEEEHLLYHSNHNGFCIRCDF